MTRARALKQAIRARAAKTGERYTTARRHILRELNPPSDNARKASPPPASTAATKPVSTKGGLSDAKTIEKTGHDLAYWFDVMDRFGGAEKGHTALTKHLYEKFEVPGWYCQGIVVAYERARGKRVMNQKCDGTFEVSVSKVIAVKTATLVKALTDPKQRKRWSGKADAALVKALEAGLTKSKSKGIVARPDGLVRYRYPWDSTTVQWYLTPKGPGKTSVVVSNMKLPGAESVEGYRAMWKATLAAIAETVTT
jgi:uncharacterized protein YndB with AHSA1/START domain